jgi:hypothetical protein
MLFSQFKNNQKMLLKLVLTLLRPLRKCEKEPFTLNDGWKRTDVRSLILSAKNEKSERRTFR